MAIRKINYTVIASEVEQEIKDKYTKSEADSLLNQKENITNKGKANGYASLDANIKIPLSQLPDTAKQQTYVVNSEIERNALNGLIQGDRCYETLTGNSYIWDGAEWLILARADWENVNLQWSNIIDKPNSSIVSIDDAVNKKHEHSNLTLLQSINQTSIDNWNNKANISDIPINTSQLTNDSEFTTKSYVDNKISEVSGGLIIP